MRKRLREFEPITALLRSINLKPRLSLWHAIHAQHAYACYIVIHALYGS